MSEVVINGGSGTRGWGSPWGRRAWIVVCLTALLWAPASTAAGRDLATLQRAVNAIAERVRGADFQGAITRAETTRPIGRDLPRSPEALELRARLEVLLSTSQVALGDDAAARRSMERAVFLWPLLDLDERTTSPRVVKLFRAVRGKSAPAKGRR